FRVPEESVRNTATRDDSADHIAQVRRLLAVDGHPVVDGSIRGHDHGIGADRGTIAYVDPCRWTGLDASHMAARTNTSAITFNCLGQAGQVLERMKLSLPRKMQTGASIKGVDRCPCKLFDRPQTSAVSCRQLALQEVAVLSLTEKKIAVNPKKIAGNVFIG